jgi:CRP/FNR family cyclic AMP-dependent transcriptional regulator
MVTFEMFQHATSFKSFSSNDVTFRKGDSGTFMDAVKEGEVDIKLGEKLLKTVGPDEIFGEMAIVDGQPRTASAIARTDCKIMSIDQTRFNFSSSRRSTFALHVMQLLVERLRRANELIEA